MFFILNNENVLIATDAKFLEYVGSDSIFALAEMFRSGDIKLEENEDICRFTGKELEFKKSSIETLFGQGWLYRSEEAEETKSEALLSIADETPEKQTTEEIEPPEEEIQEIETDEELLDLLEADEIPEQLPKKEEDAKLKKDEDILELALPEDTDKEELMDLSEEDVSTKLSESLESEEPTEENKEEKNEILELLDESLDTPEASKLNKSHIEEAEKAAIGLVGMGMAEDLVEKTTHNKLATQKEGETSLDKGDTLKTEDKDISEEFAIASEQFADYKSNAQLIGISHGEYLGFLKQFAEETVSYKDELRGNEFAVVKDRIASTKDAAGLLNLSKITDIIKEIENATSDEKDELLDRFYQYIEHIRSDLKANDKDTDKPTVKEDDNKLTKTEETPQKHTPTFEPRETANKEMLHINLSNAEAIPFDFSSKTAADELGLPESLVSEFVSDFIEQAKENLPVFEKAQNEGDLETIQKTAHLLKGAASNLRIDPLADTLKELQHNEDVGKLPDLFRKFLGQLKTLDNFTGK